MDLGLRSIHRSDLTPLDTSPLHVVTCISNPQRYKARYNLYRKFAAHIAKLGGQLWTIEAAFGRRPFEVTEASDPRHIQVRTDHEPWHSEVWLKENLLNIAISRLPYDWRYVAWIDADVQFERQDIIQETIHQLQHYHFVQMFSHAVDIGPPPTLEPLATHVGFAYCYRNEQSNPEIPPLVIDGKLNPNRMGPVHKRCVPYVTPGPGGKNYYHPGYAWAARRDAIDHVGGLLDTGILGASDHHMALALVGRGKDAMPPTVTPGYLKAVLDWELRATKHIRRNIGYVPGLITHGWHGKKASRKYWERWRILVGNKFDPFVDLKRDSQGLYLLIDHGDDRSLALRDQIRSYFGQRSEDSIDL